MGPEGFRITQQVPGGEPVDLTQDATSATWSSSIPGGFGAATVTIPRVLSLKGRGFLGDITIEHEGRVLFEGRIEDAFTRGAKTTVQTDLNAFGLQRLLSDNSVRRVWSLRNSLNPSTPQIAQGASTFGTFTFDDTNNVYYHFGVFDMGPPTGIVDGIVMDGNSMGDNDCMQVSIFVPGGITAGRIAFDLVAFGFFGTMGVCVHSTTDGVTYTRNYQQAANFEGSVEVDLVEGAQELRITAGSIGAATGGQIQAQIWNLRMFGTPLNEDTDGGWYGGTILRDVIALAPGIYPGTIEDGSDFVIAEMERTTRTDVLDVVQQIDPLYAKEWGVWEGGRFDWITPDLKSGGWLVPLADTVEWSIEQSIDSVHRRTYVTFQDAADQQFKEAVVESRNARNPYVRTGTNKDGVVAAPAAMTAITAPLLAAKLSNDFGRWPDIKGSVTLMAETIVAQAGNGSRSVPALAIRAGDNITIPDLPVEDIYAAGQDGQTVFHVTGVQASTDGTVALTLEGLTRRADVLLARLGAVSQ